jgi:hypothetical protein
MGGRRIGTGGGALVNAVMNATILYKILDYLRTCYISGKNLFSGVSSLYSHTYSILF